MERSYSSAVTDYAQGAPTDSSPLSQSVRQSQPTRLNEVIDGSRQGSSVVDGEEKEPEIIRSNSTMSQSNTLTPSRGGTLKKRQSLKKSGSLKRSNSRKSLRPGSVTSLVLEREKHPEGKDEMYSAFFIPVPTTGNPTEILAERFQAWRKILKDLIAYYRDIQKSYEARSKSFQSMSNVMNNTNMPPGFLSEGGLGEATEILRLYNKQALAESTKAKNIEEDVIVQLAGLRSDLQQKIKEIKSLSGDFKNAVDKETENTRKAVRQLQEALELKDSDPAAVSGKNDPFIVKLAVERQVERQIEEENYLHRAFLNLENSGRELESIVVGEIQKAYNAYAGILRREADEAYEAADRLKSGPIVMKKDLEWDAFVDNNEHFVDPRIPVRKAERIHYPGKDAPAAAEVRSGMLERKTKYLKSYTPGWYVLSPTHLHEFKSPDRITNQQPVMSLYLPEQKLGSHSSTDSSSHKFMLKGRQSGGMHRGHAWVFRAESQDTMLAWYEDIKNLTEKTGEERNAFVRKHARSVSAGSHKDGSISSDGAMDEDEADEVPYSGKSSHFELTSPQEAKVVDRPQPGGRFPSDLNVNRGLHVPLSPSSRTSSDDANNIITDNVMPSSPTQAKRSSDDAQNDRQIVDSISSPANSHTAPQIPPKHPNHQAPHYWTQPSTEAQITEAGIITAGAAASPGPTSNHEHITSQEVVNKSSASTSVPLQRNTDYNDHPVIQHSSYFPTQPLTSSVQPNSDLYDATPQAVQPNSDLYDATPQGSQSDLAIIHGPYQPPTQAPPNSNISATGEPIKSAVEPGDSANETSALGQEYINKAVVSQGISSDGPGAVAYASETQSPPPPNPALAAELTSSPHPSTATLGNALANTTLGPALDNPVADAPLIHEQDYPIPTTLVETPPQTPTPAPIELGEFGSTPKVQEVNKFDILTAPPLPGKANGELEDDAEEEREFISPARPKPKTSSSVSTISDLHVPGEYPRASA